MIGFFVKIIKLLFTSLLMFKLLLTVIKILLTWLKVKVVLDLVIND